MYLVTSEVEGRLASLPVEWALKKYKDDIAAYLISQMEHNRWVSTAFVELTRQLL